MNIILPFINTLLTHFKQFVDTIPKILMSMLFLSTFFTKNVLSILQSLFKIMIILFGKDTISTLTTKFQLLLPNLFDLWLLLVLLQFLFVVWEILDKALLGYKEIIIESIDSLHFFNSSFFLLFLICNKLTDFHLDQILQLQHLSPFLFLLSFALVTFIMLFALTYLQLFWNIGQWILSLELGCLWKSSIFMLYLFLLNTLIDKILC
ncbi:hypothetical protein P7E15_16525 [Enterococcus gallinarum]|nr:hypothetical protein [Enterococcus gallinarum]